MPTKKTNKTSKTTKSEGKDNVAILSYLWILCLVPLLTKKDSEFVQHHAKQGLILFIASLFTIVPFFGQILTIILIIVSVIGIIKAHNGERWEIPLVHDWSKKINL